MDRNASERNTWRDLWSSSAEIILENAASVSFYKHFSKKMVDSGKISKDEQVHGEKYILIDNALTIEQCPT